MGILKNYGSWEEVRIGDVFKIMHGKDQKAVESKNGIYPIYGTGGILGYANDFLYNSESVLIGRKGTIDKPIYLNSPFWTVDTLFYSVPVKEVNVRYLYFVFNLIDWYQYNEASGVPSLNAKTIENIKIPLPPLPEQRRIAEVLSDMDGLIGSLEKLLAKKRLIRQGMMQRLLTPQEDWEVKRLGEIAEFKNGKSFENYIVQSGIYNLITLNSIDINGRLKKNHHKVNVNDDSLLKDDIIIVLSDVAHGNFLGKSTVIKASNRFVLNQRMGCIRIKTPSIYPTFVSIVINSHQKYFKTAGKGSSQLNLGKDDILSFPVFYPGDTIQKQIIDAIENSDSEIDILEKKIRKTKQIKQGMMQKLLTGEIRL